MQKQNVITKQGSNDVIKSNPKCKTCEDKEKNPKINRKLSGDTNGNRDLSTNNTSLITSVLNETGKPIDKQP
jgi:hypothetical protein